MKFHLFRRKTKSSPRVSVIVPVYNVKPYIHHFIESLKEQTLQDLEFIFVDDCSTDGSITAAENWAAKDHRVHIIRNENNMGPGQSRNRGMEAARGDYCSFIDPDDWVSADFYKSLYAQAALTGADIAKGRRGRVRPDAQADFNNTDSLNGRIKNSREDNHLPLYCVFNAEHTSAIYKTSFLKDRGIVYGSTRNSEDATFLLRLCIETEDIVLVPSAIYFYRVSRKGSATKNYSYSRSCNEIDAIEEQFQLLFSNKTIEKRDDYATRILVNFITRYSIPYEKENLTAEQISYMQNRFVRLLDMYPDRASLLQEYPEIAAMAEHGFAIPVFFEVPEHLFRRRCEGWAHYLSIHPSEDTTMLDRLASAIDDFLCAIRDNNANEEPPHDIDEYVNNLLSQLQLSNRDALLAELNARHDRWH